MLRLGRSGVVQPACPDHGGTSATRALRHQIRRVLDVNQFYDLRAFSIAVNNTDDHLRNHGFLYLNGGWCLSPLFDVNPNPDLSEERSTSINYATDHESAKGALVAAAEYFDLDSNSAGEIWDEIIAGVADWRKVATSHGIEDHELRQFAESFESST
jgi:serine/threonine-protein kinase HipA